MDTEKLKGYSAPVLRIALSCLMLWFGLNQLFDAASWIGWLPPWVDSLPLSAELFVRLNGAAEIVLGLALLLGLLVRPVAILLALHVFGIAFSIGYNDVMIRDLGLAFAFVAVALHGKDQLCFFGQARKPT